MPRSILRAILGLKPRLHSAVAVDARLKAEHDAGEALDLGRHAAGDSTGATSLHAADPRSPTLRVILGLEPRIHSAAAVDARLKAQHDPGEVLDRHRHAEGDSANAISLHAADPLSPTLCVILALEPRIHPAAAVDARLKAQHDPRQALDRHRQTADDSTDATLLHTADAPSPTLRVILGLEPRMTPEGAVDARLKAEHDAGEVCNLRGHAAGNSADTTILHTAYAPGPTLRVILGLEPRMTPEGAVDARLKAEHDAGEVCNLRGHAAGNSADTTILHTAYAPGPTLRVILGLEPRMHPEGAADARLKAEHDAGEVCNPRGHAAGNSANTTILRPVDAPRPTLRVILGLEPRIHPAAAVDARLKAEHDTGEALDRHRQAAGDGASGCLSSAIARLLRALLSAALMSAALAGISAPAAADGLDVPAVRTDLTPTLLQRVETLTRPTTNFAKAETYEAMESGAATSTASVNDKAFANPSTNLDPARGLDFHVGNALFSQLWVSSPSSTQAADGLGPLFNARSCQTCHANGGRGHPPETPGNATTMFLRLARPARTDEERQAIASSHVINFPDATYGTQLQDIAVPGLAGEGKVTVTYTEHTITLAGGETVSLRQPTYAATDLAYGPLEPDTTVSARVAPAMLGLGLIEAIADTDILAHADPEDRDHDGIAGKAAIVRDNRTGKLALGRFGWKAQNATVRDQTSSALDTDIGISNPDRPNAYGDCTAREPQCLKMPTGVQKRLGPTEAPEAVLDLMTYYSENLAVPARRKVSDPTVLHGKEMFYQSGCIACHTPKFVTRDDAADAAQAFQLIWPYSDFLLHDMGDGLADGQPVGVATGKDWRTPPLWGIGLTKIVSGHTFFLHDGRARNLTEAVLWHGGEATKARDAFASLSKDDRQALITFVESL